MLSKSLTLVGEINVLKGNDLASFLVPAAIDRSKATFAQELLLLILIHHLPWVKIASLIIVIENVPVS